MSYRLLPASEPPGPSVQEWDWALSNRIMTKRDRGPGNRRVDERVRVRALKSNRGLWREFNNRLREAWH
jgi:hypothetical protein